jgi:hypothetical protein
MKTIPLEEAYKMLEESSAIIVDNNGLMYPSVWGLTGDDSNEFLYLSWTDGDYNEFNLQFVEGDNLEVEVSGSSLFLKDKDHKKYSTRKHSGSTQITILQVKELE